MSDKPQIAIYDCGTGESIVRDMTDEELAVHEENIARSREHAEAQQAADAQKRADDATGRQKLLDLGLSEDEVTALVGPAPVAPEPAPAV